MINPCRTITISLGQIHSQRSAGPRVYEVHARHCRALVYRLHTPWTAPQSNSGTVGALLPPRNFRWPWQVDRAHHWRGADAYEKTTEFPWTGCRAAKPEPGYRKYFDQALDFIGDVRLNYDSYLTLHKIITPPSCDAGPRWLSVYCTHGERFSHQAVSASSGYADLNYLANDGIYYFIFLNTARLNQLVRDVFDTYASNKHKARNLYEAFWLIAACHRRLECLHRFADCNTRTHLGVLYGWIAELGEPAPILTDPNSVYSVTTAAWCGAIVNGVARASAVRQVRDENPDCSAITQWLRSSYEDADDPLLPQPSLSLPFSLAWKDDQPVRGRDQDPVLVGAGAALGAVLGASTCLYLMM